MLLDFGDLVESLGGRYVTAEDVGTAPDDMAVIAERTAHVVGLPAERGGSGDPSPLTARGVQAAMRACAGAALRRAASCAGCASCVVGLGHVGARARAAARGRRRRAASSPTSTRQARARRGARAPAGSSPARRCSAPCDVLAPCALGGAVDAATVERAALRRSSAARPTTCSPTTRWPSGSRERGILYAPDFIANAGGLISVYARAPRLRRRRRRRRRGRSASRD